MYINKMGTCLEMCHHSHSLKKVPSPIAGELESAKQKYTDLATRLKRYTREADVRRISSVF